jgi:hypothetical protein
MVLYKYNSFEEVLVLALELVLGDEEVLHNGRNGEERWLMVSSL